MEQHILNKGVNFDKLFQVFIIYIVVVLQLGSWPVGSVAQGPCILAESSNCFDSAVLCRTDPVEEQHCLTFLERI